MTRIRRHRRLSESESAREMRVQELVEAQEIGHCFGQNGDIWLEIGTGKDTHILERSLRHPGDLHLGIEHTRKKVESMLRKAEALGCKENLKLLHADAFVVIQECFPANCLSGAFLLFPDPWPKVRHAHRRLLQTSFLSLVVEKLQFGASLEIRTDEYEYAEQAQQALQEIDSLENLMDGKPWLKAPNNPELHVQTLFEQRFLKKEKPIHYFYLKKKDDDCRS